MKVSSKVLSILAVLAMLSPGKLSGQKAAPETETSAGYSGQAEGAHRGAVNVLLPVGGLPDAGTVYSAGADGFLGVWDCRTNEALERFQISPWAISHLSIRPAAPGGPDQLAAAEKGPNRYRLSVWDMESKTKLFSLELQYPVTFLSYSASGNFLVAATQGSPGVLFLDPQTGAALDTAPRCDDRITFAATGKSEKSMLTYAPSGFLSYWELETGEEIRRYNVSRNLSSPILFGSRRFFAGIGQDGLSLYDAVSGSLIVREKSITRGSLVPAGADSTDFYCIQPNKITHYFLTGWGKLEAQDQFAVSQPAGGINCAFPNGERIIAGGASGVLFGLEPSGAITQFAALNPLRVSETAPSGSFLAFFAEDKTMGAIPLDYRNLRNGSELALLANQDVYGRITPADPVSSGAKTGSFIFWQTANTRIFPAIWTAKASPVHNDGLSFSLARNSVLSKLPLRANLRSVSACKGKALFLTMRGALSAVSLPGQGGKDAGSVLQDENNTAENPVPETAEADGTPWFSAQIPGAADAAFASFTGKTENKGKPENPKDEIILGMGVLTGPPFARFPLETGKLAPFDLHPAAGVRLYPGAEKLYGLASGKDSEGAFTQVFVFDAAGYREIAVYREEDQNMSLAETSAKDGKTKIWAANPGGESAELYTEHGPVPFERGPGFPLKLSGGTASFIVLDTDGHITWYDPETGQALAVFTLYDERWVLKDSGGVKASGNVTRG
jgi:hypothetical protein